MKNYTYIWKIRHLSPKYLLTRMFNFKNISIIILIFVLSLNLLLDFSFVTNNFGKNLREFTFNYIVPFKNIGNLEKKIEELENINRQKLAATIQVDEKNINDLEENIQKIIELLESGKVQRDLVYEQNISYLSKIKIGMPFSYQNSNNIKLNKLISKFYRSFYGNIDVIDSRSKLLRDKFAIPLFTNASLSE